MGHIFERFLKNISSWACTTKIYILLHRCLQDPAGNLSTNMAKELKTKEHLIHSFQKKASDDSYDTKMYFDIISLYNTYLKFLFNFKARSPLLTAKMSEVSVGLKKASMNEILQCYESFDAMLTQIFSIFEH